MFLRSGERRKSQLRRRIRMARGAARVGATLGSGGKGGISPPAGGKVASRPSRAARRQHVSRRLGASAGQTGARGGRAPGGPAPAARRRAATSEAAGGEGWITRSRGDRRPSGEGGGWTTQRSLRPSREKTSRTTRATFSKRMRGSPSAPVSAGGRSFEEVFNAVLAGRAGHGVGGGGRHILHGRGVPETARSKTGSASSISHRQWRNRLNAGGESWEAGHGRQAGAHRHRLHRPSRINQCGTSKDIA
jgi:hypothetical protein